MRAAACHPVLGLLWAAAAGVAATAQSRAQQAETPPALVETDGHARYRVRMVTEVEIPAQAADTIRRLVARHAIPTKRPWSEVDGDEGATAISFVPEEGSLGYHGEYDSHQVVWEVTSGLEAGAELVFETEFSVVSCNRRFLAREAQTSWESYKNTTVRVPDAQRTAEIPVELVRFAEDVKGRLDPHEAVLEFCEWIRGQMSYDVRWDHENLESIFPNTDGSKWSPPSRATPSRFQRNTCRTTGGFRISMSPGRGRRPGAEG